MDVVVDDILKTLEMERNLELIYLACVLFATRSEQK